MSERERMAQVLHDAHSLYRLPHLETWDKQPSEQTKDLYRHMADAVLAQRSEPGHCDLDDADCCGACHHALRAQLAAAQEAREMAKARVKEMEALVTNAAVRRYEALAKMEYRAEQAERDKVELLGVEKKLLDEVEQAEAQLERTGYRRCDIPACNCGGWHPGERSAYAEADRLRSHLKALRAALSNLLQQARPVSMGWRKVRLEVTMEPEVYDALRALLAEPGA